VSAVSFVRLSGFLVQDQEIVRQRSVWDIIATVTYSVSP